MKLIKFLILPFLSVLVFAQTATDKKLITAGNYYKNKEYSQVIETLKNESPSDYRVLFFNIASKYELQDSSTSVDDIYEIKNIASEYLKKYTNKNKTYSSKIEEIYNYYKNNYPETKEQYYIQREKEIAAQKEKEKQNKIAEIQEAIDYKNFESANNLINIYKNGDIEEYYFSYFRALIAFEQLKEMELYDFNQDLSPTKKLLESYLAQYKEKNSNYSDNINKDLAYLSAHYPRTIEEYNLIKKELEQKKIEKENALKLDDIKRNFESGYYSVVSDMANSFPNNTKYEAEVLYYKAMADYKLLENKKNEDNLQYKDIAETKNKITNIINNNHFKNSTFYSDVNNLLTNINSNYPKSQEEWNQIQEEKRKQEEKIRKEKQKAQAKLNRKNKSLGSFVAFGYEGGTIAKYGARFEIGGNNFMGFFINARTSLINDGDLQKNSSVIENKNEAVIGTNFRITKWLYLNVGAGYGYYKYAFRNDYANTQTLETKYYYAGYSGLTIRLGNRFNLVGGTSFIDVTKDFYAPEYTFGLTVNFK